MMLTIKSFAYKKLLDTDLYALRDESTAVGHGVIAFPVGSSAWWDSLSGDMLQWNSKRDSMYATLDLEVGGGTTYPLGIYHKIKGARAGETRLQKMRLSPPDTWRKALKKRPEPGRSALFLLRASDDRVYGRVVIDIGALPDAMRSQIARASQNAAWIDLSAQGGSVVEDPNIARVVEALRLKNNVILVGPPGTGKTFLMTSVQRVFEKGGDSVLFDPSDLKAPFKAQLRNPLCPERKPRDVRFVTFHQSYGYESFVSGLRPISSGGSLVFETTVGPFLKAAEAAYTGGAALILIDEINRGNAAEVFGELITLLESDKRLGPDNETEYSGQTPIGTVLPYPPSNLKVVDKATGVFRLPKHVYVLATMNSVDRSVAPLDAALRRRFAVIELAPDMALLRQRLVSIGESIAADSRASWVELGELACRLLEGLNHRIAILRGSDFMLGHAYVWDAFLEDGSAVGVREERLIRAVAEKIVPQVREMFRDDAESIRFLLPQAKELYRIHDGSELRVPGMAPAGYVQWNLPEIGNRSAWRDVLTRLADELVPTDDSSEEADEGVDDGPEGEEE
jgi:5-methylcytosine-specific restriction protein B